MRTLAIFLEERSAHVMLEGLLPRILPPDCIPKYIVFEGKQDLEIQLERKLRKWQAPDSAFLVLRDQDSGDCLKVKSRLAGICRSAGRGQTVVRIACRELESWYLGDLQAVEDAFGVRGIARRSREKKFRNPDLLGNPSQELAKLTDGRYQKVSGSRALGRILNPDSNTSPSFRMLIDGIRRLAA